MNELMPIELIIAAAPQYQPARTQKHDSPKDDPCLTCVCPWVCSGAQREGGKPNWSLAMACTMFKQFIQPTAVARKRTVNPNKMPRREVYVKVFG